MNTELSRNQRLKFFFINVAAFASIFLLLGFITLQLLQSSAYRQTDLSLTQMAKNTHLIQIEINRYQQDDPFLAQPNNQRIEHGPDGNNRFNSQIILWSKDGKILNKNVLGGRFTELASLSLDNEHLDAIQTLTLKNTSDVTQKLSFHSYTIKADNQDGQVAYIQFLANTNQIADSMKTFKTILIVCMVVFWLISIGISFYISKMNMKPIMNAWHKQQEFVENASHELRTPLTIIQNSLQRLFTKPEHTILEESEPIAQALNETRRMKSLTEDLLTLARSDSNQLVLQKEQIDPSIFIQQLAQPFQEIAEMEAKHFVLENFTDRPMLIDEKRIHQVLVILLDNALKYTNAGEMIVLQSELSSDNWLIEVKNNGPSISDEDKKYIFERFYREDHSRSKETGGYGLGLSIAKQIITQHKGKLTVHDWLPKGVVFQIRLPLKKYHQIDKKI
ncbi:HAMP domain-containing sensor histidine kinase [Enterococcus dongliensis]|uniref:sensor histidine kinase n=1 Tax=Enterococcus dongliensis TaxID=2559925 RepID=UPI00288E4631|nr:HAMP domain-containing sensor histidine kinase [Enterococcus dongliensis]MDT2604022.1 HAMP domain-containing sensor histidine kinase [Enterococcus dongliensis]MDT2638710.1 HAMP domain-containing sensor histidine kinase [Enterococcus dongliensis]MDT2645176.1 HAMP domain-containing sensor histidine kinase [Enterococcus dongliensis]MDT2671604.1 HAMP domain-containing sensor histidine kinase [Enterococcus dongliensis]MDT2676736.1 HAMP domain-containing sensor histidine kinase [Enterococcus dong